MSSGAVALGAAVVFLAVVLLLVDSNRRAIAGERNGTQRVLLFYEKYVLAAARPVGVEGGLGRDVKLREVLDAAVPKIGSMANGGITIPDTGVYGNKYLHRAAVTLAGLGANPAEDAVYPILATDADGAPVDGANQYVLHFDADGLPPVGAFWSLTMYDGEGFQIPNEIDRYALGDRDPLVYNPDGSLDIHIGPSNPGPDREANWLPSQPGPLGPTLRLYAPRASVLDGTWHPPAVRRV